MSKFTYVSLFCGIGGFELGLNSLGGECVMASDIDRFARQSYEAIHGVEPLGDVTIIEASDVPDHDLLVGGFPCQSFSVAGKMGGLDDARGTLFFDIARIADAKRPKALLLENVKGLVNHDKGKTLDLMLKTLNDIGYVVDFEVLNSKYFDVPQSRERIFIVAVREDLIWPEPFNAQALKGSTIIPRRKRDVGTWAKVFNYPYPEQSEVRKKLRDILEEDVDDKYYLDPEKTQALLAQTGELDAKDSDGVVLGEPSIKRVGNLNPSGRGMGGDVFSSDNSLSPCVTTGKGEGTMILTGEQVPKGFPLPDQVSRTVRTGGKSSLTDKHNWDHIAEEQTPLKIREATKRGFAEAYPGDSINIVYPESKTRRGRVSKDVSGTLMAANADQGVLTPTYRIRKLSPLECWRLQGFDDATFYKAKDAGISDSQLYKQAGNAVTVSVIKAVAAPLIAVITDLNQADILGSIDDLLNL